MNLVNHRNNVNKKTDRTTVMKEPSQSEVNESKHTEGIGTEETSHKKHLKLNEGTWNFHFQLGAGIGYAAIGLWLIFDKRNSKIPYIIALVGSLVLLGIYIFSRTVGIFSLGIEPSWNIGCVL